MPPIVAEPTSSHDIFENIFATIASGAKVFRSASSVICVGGGRHESVAIPASPVLAVKGLITQLAELWHGTSKIMDDPESCRGLHRRPCTRPL